MANAPTSHGERETALADYVADKVAELQDRYRRRDSEALAAMAKLRRGVGGNPGTDPALWGLTLAEMPEHITAREIMTRDERDGASTVWERAAYDAITLHALHQQSRSDRMHRRGTTIGTATAALGARAGAQDAVRARFHALGTASDHDARLIHLRGLISQLRGYDIPLDYARLAVDLCRLDDGTYADRVLLAWGRDYHRRPATTSNTDNAAPAPGDPL
ncbi:type I-E CRISPR-associated protein Cse2/CasB [Nocardia sp. NBC_00881]|uniref:type I-E CRISPR-associated protein Cse2/CasB n=1 Tax=Nocardia sp. NBC_00881 TaxID=2975995 RepID=UPI003866A849|nr:type I-E CRISPR-associated protein Cse2/CasB [Nocardia sp. NBC_00881]